jgi:hypothetical protein
LFSDESKLYLKFSDGRVRIYRRRRERFADGCVKETDRFGGGGVMVLGGISHVGKTNIKIVVGNLNGIRYRDEILAPIVLPFIRTHHFNHVYQQDNARCHISCVAMNVLNDNHICTLPWPALSPDLNPQALVSFKKYMPPPLPYFKVNIYPFSLPHFASIFFTYL